MDYHDVLAAVGASSAHPGGFATTRIWMDRLALNPEERVLDVGCGTGRTALELQQRFGCAVTGVDIRKEMIRKAKERGRLLGAPARWLLGSAESLPVPSNEFDLVVTESVNVFVDASKALGEYVRALKPQGVYVDVEMMAMGPVPPEFHASAQAVYGAKRVPDLRGWKRLYHDAGFTAVEVVGTYPVRPEDTLASDEAHPDPVQLAKPEAYKDPRVLAVLRANSVWLEENHRWLAYGVFMCQKTG